MLETLQHRPLMLKGSSFTSCGGFLTLDGQPPREFPALLLGHYGYHRGWEQELAKHLDAYAPLPEVVITSMQWTGPYAPSYDRTGRMVATLISRGVKLIADRKSRERLYVYCDPHALLGQGGTQSEDLLLMEVLGATLHFPELPEPSPK